jgi:hypothetical protein
MLLVYNYQDDPIFYQAAIKEIEFNEFLLSWESKNIISKTSE